MTRHRLKIAFLVGKFPAISETFILNQITGLIDAGHEVDIYAKGRSDDKKVQAEVETYGLMKRTRYFRVPANAGERVFKAVGMWANMVRYGKGRKIARALDFHAYGRNAASLRLLYLLYPVLQNGPYDILHCHFGPVGLSGVQLKEMGVPGKLIVTFHGHDLSRFTASKQGDIYHQLFDCADLLMPISHYWKQRLMQYGASADDILVHRMGIDLRDFAFLPRTLRGQDEIRLLTVGRLVEKKGIPFALHAVSRVHKRHPDWKIRYEIIGGGEQEDDLHRLIQQFDLQGVAHLLGPKTREEIRQHIAQAHVFLLPSVTDVNGDQEGIPVSLMEAMATGMPVLSTRHSGIPELVQDGSTGYLVAERDIDGLSARLEQLILHPERWPEMGRNARRFVEANHDIRKLNQQLIATYYGLISGTLEVMPEETGPVKAPVQIR